MPLPPSRPPRRGGPVAVLLLAAFALSACASRPEGVLVPVGPPPPGSATVDMLAATTRAPSAERGVLFSGERGEGVSYTNLVVSIPPGRPVGTVQWPNPRAIDARSSFAVSSVTDVPPGDIGTWFRRVKGSKRRVLIFVHGFNTRFDVAVFTYAQLVHDMGTDVVPVLFTWPSRGRVLHYNFDRESTNFSRTDLADVIRAASASPEVDDVVVLAHSMGAWLTVEALRQIALQNGRVPAKVSNVILASPDLDIDVFRRQVTEMGPQRPQITIFVSHRDRALRLSGLIAGRVARVGAIDFTEEAKAARLGAATGIVVIDLSRVESGDALNHGQFANSPPVVRLLGERLIAGQSIDEETFTGSDVAHDVAQTVGNVMAAPFIVFTAGRK
ncbi:alpha/beta fold hydrolase [Pseudoxanthobacter sp.]|uniref:alpha/beta hydrolase n=1 Tax=Pseudoxanthobacter sp. TaxID=1925742 RepID=UPI002FE1B08A